MTPPPAGKSDRDKFERARNLKKHIVGIRAAITKASFACTLLFPLFFFRIVVTRDTSQGLLSKSDVEAQLFTATW